MATVDHSLHPCIFYVSMRQLIGKSHSDARNGIYQAEASLQDPLRFRHTRQSIRRHVFINSLLVPQNFKNSLSSVVFSSWDSCHRLLFFLRDRTGFTSLLRAPCLVFFIQDLANFFLRREPSEELVVSAL